MLDWFTTIPGILIICGVILLLISIVLFIAGAKKSKKEGTVSTSSAVNAMPQVNESNSINVAPVMPVTEDVNVSSNSMNTVVDIPVTEPVNVGVNTINNEVVEDNGIPTFEPIRIEEEKPVVDTNITNDLPAFNQVDNTPVVNIPDMNVNFSEVTSVPTEESSTIYGGQAPVVDFTVSEEKPVTIYGGNDPLEATQALPKIEENHVPYGGSYPEVTIVDTPTFNEVQTPVEDVVTEIHQQEEPVTIPQPTVVDIPVIEPTVNQPEVKEPEVTPVVDTTNQVTPTVVEEL